MKLLRHYYCERSLLSLNDGVVTYELQIVIPPKMRDDALQRLYESHRGISKCRERAASAIWWPGISRDIKRFIDRCDTCRRNRPTQREQPLRPAELPGRPCVISRVKSLFTMHGISDVVASDNSRKFVSDEFRKFARSWCFAQHILRKRMDGRANCADGEKIARPRRTGDRYAELSYVAPQCNRRLTCSGTNGSSTRHTIARCERTVVATSAQR